MDGVSEYVPIILLLTYMLINLTLSPFPLFIPENKLHREQGVCVLISIVHKTYSITYNNINIAVASLHTELNFLFANRRSSRYTCII